MTVSDIFAIAGCIMLFFGILGKDIVFREVKIPSPELPARIVMGVLGVIFITTSLFFSKLSSMLETPLTPTPYPTHTNTPAIVLASATSTPYPLPTQTPSATPRVFSPKIVSDGLLFENYTMGLSTSNGLTNWVEQIDEAICMSYPKKQDWGVAFITVKGDTNNSNLGEDFSAYKTLSMELMSSVNNQSVSIGVKDVADPNDGSETKVVVSNIKSDWATYTIPLSSFKNADLKNLHVVTEFVFEKETPTICVRNIEFLP